MSCYRVTTRMITTAAVMSVLLNQQSKAVNIPESAEEIATTAAYLKYCPRTRELAEEIKRRAESLTERAKTHLNPQTLPDDLKIFQREALTMKKFSFIIRQCSSNE